ncbi:MAG: GNAT family N-acetyltransferase [Pseudohongiella sp.]|jgi:ElaA protein|nr:GNAT family N-acetyltransferase [Pseudohongiella sp.]
MSSKLTWQCCQFEELQAQPLYQILQLRAEAFVVEQECIYQDMDDYDQQAHHLTACSEDALLCYSRLLPPGLKYAGPSIGRVITRHSVRGEGFGKLLMQRSIDSCHERWPGQTIFISAQQQLELFYSSLGFSTQSEPYREDGIPHIQMLLEYPFA